MSYLGVNIHGFDIMPKKQECLTTSLVIRHGPMKDYREIEFPIIPFKG
jgi:hypothetical protein